MSGLLTKFSGSACLKILVAQQLQIAVLSERSQLGNAT